MNSKSREACQRCRSLAGVRGANLRDGRTGRFLPGGVWYVAGGGASSANVVPPCPMPAPRLPVVSPHLHAVPFIRVPPLPFTLPSPDLTCSDGGWPLAVPAVIAMKMTPVLHRVDGPASRLCRAAIPGAGSCAGKGLAGGGGGSSYGGSDETLIDCSEDKGTEE